MKVFKKSALVLAMTASAGMAHAAGFIDIQPGTFAGGPATADVDVVGNSSGAVGLSSLLSSDSAIIDLTDSAQVTAGVRSIVYSPNTAISQNSTITFEVSNGAIAAEDSAGAALPLPSLVNRAGTPAVVGNLIDFTTDADGNYTSLRFQVVTQDLVAGNGYNLAYDDSAGAGAFPDASVVTDAGLSVGQSVSIEAVSAQDPSAIPIAQGIAPSENLVTVVEPLSVTLDSVTSIIDVEASPSRTTFVQNAGVTSPSLGDDEAETSDGVVGTGSEPIVSRASFNVETVAEVTPDLTGTDFTVTLQRSNVDGVDDVVLDVAGGSNLGGGSATFTQNGSVFTFTDTNAAVLTAPAGGVTHNLDIVVNGSTPLEVLQTGAWTLDIDVDAGSNFSAFSVVDAATSHNWQINGAQFKIPYHAQNAPGFNFFFNVVNEGSNDANVFADVIVENKSQNTREEETNVLLGSAVAQGSTTIGQDAIKQALRDAGLTVNDEDIYHVAMTLTVIAPRNEVQVAAFQKDAIGRTSVPVYVNTSNDNDGREWQQ